MGRLFDFRHWTLGWKLSLTFCVVILIVAMLMSLFVIRHEERALDTELRLRGEDLAENLARLSVDLLMQDDEWGLYRLSRDLVRGQARPEGTAKIVVHAAIVKQDGIVLAHSDPGHVRPGKPWPDPMFLRRMQTATSPVLQPKQGAKGEELYEFAAPVMVDRVKIGAAVVGITREPLRLAMMKLKQEVFLIVSGLALLGILMGVLLDQRITRPLKRLSASVAALVHGRFDEWVEVQTAEKDEIGQLADAFNQMAATLREKLKELHGARQYLENLLEQANDFIYTLDSQGRFTYVNRKFEEWGYSKNELVGQPFTVILGSQHEGRRSRKTLEDGLRQTYEMEIVSQLDGSRVGMVSTTPLTDSKGTTIGLLGIIRDVTVMKQMEQELVAREKLASVGQLAAGIAHEINNPIGIVLGFTQDILERMEHTPPSRRSIEIIQEEIDRCHRVLRQLLHFSRPLPPMIALTSVKETVERSLELISPRAAKAGVKMVIDLPPSLPDVEADRQQLQQVLINLYLNAIQAMPGGGILTTSVRVVEEPLNGARRSLQVSVTDTGRGIAKEDLPDLFTPFFSRNHQTGTGLGLSVSKRIIEAHHGVLTLADSDSNGSTFVIRLPEAVGRGRASRTIPAQGQG
jgi:PAS domain S-box-containing protein